MASATEPLDEVSLWGRRPAGQVSAPVQVAIGAGAALGVAALAAAAHAHWKLAGAYPATADSRYYPPLAGLAALTCAVLPRARVSRFVRTVVALPLMHALALGVVWSMVATGNATRTSVEDTLPVPWLLAAVAAATASAAWIVGRRREVAHAAVVIALANLLLLGLWLPIVARLPALHAATDSLETWNALASPRRAVALLLVPPFALACAYAALVVRWPRATARLRDLATVVVVVLLLVAVGARMRTPAGAQRAYEQLVYPLLVVAAVAIAATLILGVTTWFSCRRDRRALGAAPPQTIEACGDGEAIACLEITSWLRGPRAWVRPFVASSARGPIVVPAASLATTLPFASTLLNVGESLIVLRTGDRIAMSEPDGDTGDGPYRTTSTVDGDVLVGPHEGGTSPLVSVQLVMWRPSVAYITIAAAAMLPAIIGVAAPG